MLSLGALLLCGTNRKQEGRCHQLWEVGSSTSPQRFCLSEEAKDELRSIHLNSSQLGPKNGLLVVRPTSGAWDGPFPSLQTLNLWAELGANSTSLETGATENT